MRNIELAAQGKGRLSEHSAKQVAPEFLLEHVGTDSDVKRYLYGECEGEK